jgi:hypothetical protein
VPRSFGLMRPLHMLIHSKPRAKSKIGSPTTQANTSISVVLNDIRAKNVRNSEALQPLFVWIHSVRTDLCGRGRNF